MTVFVRGDAPKNFQMPRICILEAHSNAPGLKKNSDSIKIWCYRIYYMFVFLLSIPILSYKPLYIYRLRVIHRNRCHMNKHQCQSELKITIILSKIIMLNIREHRLLYNFDNTFMVTWKCSSPSHDNMTVESPDLHSLKFRNNSIKYECSIKLPYWWSICWRYCLFKYTNRKKNCFEENENKQIKEFVHRLPKIYTNGANIAVSHLQGSQSLL